MYHEQKENIICIIKIIMLPIFHTTKEDEKMEYIKFGSSKL